MLFFGIKAAVLAVVIEALHRIAKRALKNGVLLAIAAAAFVAIFFFEVPFPLIVLAAGLIGFFGSRALPNFFLLRNANGQAGGDGEEGLVDRKVTTAIWEKKIASCVKTSSQPRRNSKSTTGAAQSQS